MAWDVANIWDVLSRVAKNGMGCFVYECLVRLAEAHMNIDDSDETDMYPLFEEHSLFQSSGYV